MSTGSIWRTLGIRSTRDRGEIRRAYAAKLKVVHPEDDAEGFQALRAAYEQALRMAAQAPPQVIAAADWAADEDDAPPFMDARLAEALVETLLSEPLDPGDLEPTAPDPARGPAIERVSRDELDALGAALADLRAAVAAGDQEAARAGLKAVLGAAAMDSVSVRGQVEGEVGSLILNGGRGAAVLIDPATAAFGWDSQRLGATAGLAAAVRQRRADLVLLLTLQVKGSAHNPAYRALTERPVGVRLWLNRITPWLPGKVRLLLDLIYSAHPGLVRELDTEAVAWWSGFFRTPQIGPGAVWTALVAPLWAAAVVGQDSVFGLKGGASYAAAYGLALPPVLAAIAIWIFGLARGRARWRETWTYGAPDWLRYGWAGLLLANLAFAAALPGSGWIWPLVAAPLAVAGFAWAVITAEPDQVGPVDMVYSLPFSWLFPFLRIPARTPQWVLLSFGLIPLLLVWSAVGTEMVDAIPRMTLPFVATAMAFVAGHHSLEAAWRYRVAPAVRRWVVTAAALVTAGVPYLLWLTAPGPAFVPLAISGVAALVFGERIVSLGWDGRWWRDRIFHWGAFPALMGAVICSDDVRHGNGVLLCGGIWLLAGVAAGLISAVLRERVQAAYAPA